MFWSSLSPWKNALPTLLFYLLYVGVITFLEKLYPSGMCGPSISFFFILAFPIWNVVLLIKNFFQWRIWEQPKQVSFSIHLLMLLSMGALLALANS